MASNTYDRQEVRLSIAMMVLTILAIILRFISRATVLDPERKLSRLWWDDWLALIATSFILAMLILFINGCSLGMGQHINQISLLNLPSIGKILYANYLTYTAGVSLARASVLCFYSRIFNTMTGPKWFTYILRATHVLNATWSIATLVAIVFTCSPIPKLWTPSLPGHCASMDTRFVTVAIGGSLLDLLILILPLPMIWRLQLGTMRKIGLVCIFLLGYAVVVSIGRTATVLIATYRETESIRTDPTYVESSFFCWFIADGPVTTICISIPAFIGLGRRAYGSLTSKHNSSSPKASKLPSESPSASSSYSYKISHVHMDEIPPETDFHGKDV